VERAAQGPAGFEQSALGGAGGDPEGGGDLLVGVALDVEQDENFALSLGKGAD
jgi:hypothetical protein